MPQSTAQSEMTPKAAAAFAAYVDMGDGRSLEKLAEQRVQQKLYKNSSSALRTLAKWSSDYRWQERIARATTQSANEKLAEAAELDADTFLRSSQKLNDDIRTATETETVIRIRESVRKPTPKGGTSVNVNVSVEIREMVERAAAEDGLTEDEKAELMERVQRYMAVTR